MSKDNFLYEETKPFAKKSLGQHFLFDLNLTRKIAQQAGDLKEETVLEVGPGPGGLTKALLETPLKRLILIEKDERFAKEWSARARSDNRLTVIHDDALSVDEAALLASFEQTPTAKIISNLPYNVGTPLLLKWLKADRWRGEMALMFQLEVAERICAEPGDSAYGRLSVMAQSRAAPHLAMRVQARAFTPPPKVESAIVRFDLIPEAKVFADWRSLEAVTAAAFGQRRKMLRQSLKALANNCGLPVSVLIEHAGLDETARAETITPAGFQKLATAYAQASGEHIAAAKAATSN